MTIDDDLPAGFDWEITAEQGVPASEGDNCTIDDSVDPMNWTARSGTSLRAIRTR